MTDRTPNVGEADLLETIVAATRRIVEVRQAGARVASPDEVDGPLRIARGPAFPGA